METLTNDKENFVTVVAVGPDQFEAADTNPVNNSGYVTVLTIGDSTPKETTEQVLVYRLPGERLGFGLKFEGGTKANEFVKRLFIQSCAPDSPASRVQSSWGKLAEGDEVLEIDCTPVNTMTRIDCVRCLKDSNVVIKLLVRHFTHAKQSRSLEDLPQVVSAEKKRTPPPPPPVPPRKIPKKYYKNNSAVGNVQSNDNPVPAVRHNINSEVTVSAKSNCKKAQSPRSSGRASHSPDIPRRDRRFSDGSLGPPNAEVYVDLFSQESAQSLSESDDTGSTISTVVDKFGSFPTTTASSLAGSLPSTPTSVQKHLDFSTVLSSYDDEEISNALKNTVKLTISKSVEISDKIADKTENVTVNGDEGVPLQPPSCFQDAPLSYGNENMRIIDSMTNKTGDMKDKKVVKKPPVPPRARDLINAQNKSETKENIHDENMNISNLPRLVDFVPKTTKADNFDSSAEIIQVFLENERRGGDNYLNGYGDNLDLDLDVYSNDLYSSKWSLSSQLATIGEVEEEGSPDSNTSRSTPIVIVENADCDLSHEGATKQSQAVQDINGKMETLPSDSRQPPDGHEFPDYVESNTETTRQNYNAFSQQLSAAETLAKPLKTYKSIECVNLSQNRSSFNEFSSVPIQNKPLNKINSVSNSDLSTINPKSDPYDSSDEVQLRRKSLDPSLHTRSQSLIDMSSISKQKNDRWSLLAEQRKKGLSKLKGLVIPEHVSESETAPAVNIPEIISHTAPSFVIETKTNANSNSARSHQGEPEPLALPLTSPPWSSNSSNLPKYSPAFKRKSLQVYPTIKNQKYEDPEPVNVKPVTVKTVARTKLDNDEFRLDNLSDSPKSLESITSPTRSDCSFDYVTNSFKTPNKTNNSVSKASNKESINYISKLHKDLGKSEDESDNDSAVSSSQSSYISRCSPPPSPTRSCEMLDYDSTNIRAKSDDATHCRLLKPASVEAINRKNILASAKCRSGRDLKVGSPVIQRKYEEDGDDVAEPPPTPPQENGTSPISRVIIAKERRSISCEETIKHVETKKESEIIPERKTYAPAKREFTPRTEITKTDYSRTSSSSLRKNAKSMSVTDLRKSFERFGSAPPPMPHNVPVTVVKDLNKRETRKIDSSRIQIDKKPDPKGAPKRTSDKIDLKPQPIVPPPTSPSDSSSSPSQRTVVLCPEFFGGSIGITLAGGTDYETKEITVHKIRYGSVAYNDGQLKKGDRIVSINGKSTSGVTHSESVEMLKEAVSKFVLLVEEGKPEVLLSPQRKSFVYETPEPKSPTATVTAATIVPAKNVTNVVSLIKDGAGLGFSIEGGKDSPLGDLPLRVKKIFQGGAADKSGGLEAGDEILSINDTNVTNMSKIEAWTLMKKLPDGNVTIHIHR